jgi:hypothetical protein
MLALRMDWGTGRGFASARQIGEDADVSEPTVRRATRWGRDNELLLQTRRGHRISNELVIASEWQLTMPVDLRIVDNSSQPLTGDRLGKPTDQNGRPNRSIGPTQPITTDAPSRTVSSRTVTSAGPRTEACKSGDHQLCMFTWCTCACGHRGRRS